MADPLVSIYHNDDTSNDNNSSFIEILNDFEYEDIFISNYNSLQSIFYKIDTLQCSLRILDLSNNDIGDNNLHYILSNPLAVTIQYLDLRYI